MQRSRGTALLSRALPFALFMAFIGVEEGARMMAAAGWINLPRTALCYLYPFKALSVALLLYLYRHEYGEFTLKDLTRDKSWAWVIVIGLATCVLWIFMDWTVTVAGGPAGFDPTLLPAGPVRIVMTLFRVAGAVLVVPLMEELFWRSFLLRYLIHADFEGVALGSFTWTSFLVTAVLFGLEHHLFLAGVAAGAIYSLILYKTRSIVHCVLAHAVTNLSLAGYVLVASKWQFW